MGTETGMFWHECEEPYCKVQVEADDEPWCPRHWPVEGPKAVGYSAAAQNERRLERAALGEIQLSPRAKAAAEIKRDQAREMRRRLAARGENNGD